jgi:hypothetical protein
MRQKKGLVFMKELLPIGSVVLLKESTKRVMIVGLKQKQVDDDKIWDYSACIYPEGILDPDHLFLFDNNQIETLFFMGYQDGEGMQYMVNLNSQQ